MKGKNRVYVDGRFIVFRVSKDYNYGVCLDRLKSKTDVLRWREHLEEKNWCDEMMLSQFVKLAYEHNGLV